MTLNFDDAFSNSRYIEGAEQYPPRWAAEAAAFRRRLLACGRAELELSYGASERGRVDLFFPERAAKGLFVFVHGGYWMSFDKSSWSHLAAGALERGWAVAVPSYTLAPAARIAEITREVGRAIEFVASRIHEPLRLAGHSAGGHLVTRMICADSPLPEAVRARVEQVVSISGLHDLRPLLATAMNDTLRLDAAEATAESAALKWPATGAKIVCWVGSRERPEFLRQADLLANIWSGLGAAIRVVRAEGKHHFDVIDGLADSESELARLCAP